MSVARSRRRTCSNRSGAILPFIAVSLTGVMGVVAIAIDVGSLERERRLMQTAADAGALAGASELYRGRTDLVDGSARTESARNGMSDGVAGVVVTPRIGPATGFYTGNNRYVEVVVTRQTPTLFGNILGRSTVAVSARGVAGADAPSLNCLFLLHPTADKALNVSSNPARLNAGCGITVNSSHSQAVLIESGGRLDATSLGVAGRIDASGGILNVSGSIQTSVPPSPDPLASLQMPSFDPNACDYTNTKVDSYGVTTVLSPGIYCGGIEITSNGTASLNPGLYVLRGGGLKMGGGSITGTGVTFINTNGRAADGGADKFGKFEMGSASRATLSAMSTGTLAGILFFQDPAAGKSGVVYENVFASGSNTVLTGTFYFPTQPIELGASGSTTIINGGVVAMTAKVTSGSLVTITGNTPGMTPLFKRVALVE